MNLPERLRGMDASRKAVLLAVVWLLLPSLLWVWWDERTLPDVRGAWASVGCEESENDAGASRIKRRLSLDGEAWRLTVDFYGDEGCVTRLFSVDVEGAYELGPDAMSPRDATTARFDIAKLTLTPRTEPAANAFTVGGCGDGGWSVDQGQEVTQLGCGDLVPTAATCPTEYDIVKIEGDKMYLGDRSAGLCVPDRYPERFMPSPLVRT